MSEHKLEAQDLRDWMAEQPDWVRQVVDNAPPLTAWQRAEVARIMSGGVSPNVHP